MTANRVIAWLTGILTLLLALFSFVLSFSALMDLAGKHGVAIPALFPLMVEAGVVIFSLNALYRSLVGESAKMQWGLIIGSSMLAGLFNIAHADPSFLSRTMAAMPSLFLLLSFETFLGQVKHAVKRSSIVENLEQLESTLGQKQQEFKDRLKQMRSTLRSRFEQERSTLKAEIEQLGSDLRNNRLEAERIAEQIEALTTKKSELEQEINRLKQDKKATSIVQHNVLNEVNEQRLNDKQTALNVLLDFYRSNPNATLNEAGEIINRSKGTVSNYLNELEQNGSIKRNGNGVEVIA